MRHVTAQSQEQLLSFLVAIPEQTKFENPYGKGIFMNFILTKLWATEIREWVRGMYMNIYIYTKCMN